MVGKSGAAWRFAAKKADRAASTIDSRYKAEKMA
jgi:hypothetical protein